VGAFRDLLINLAASVVLATLGFVAGQAFQRVKDRRSYGHIGLLLGRARKEPIVFVFPRSHDAGGSAEPSNAIYMSLAEGAAIARLIQAVHSVRPGAKVNLTESHGFNQEGGPFISVGGPLVNPTSKELIARYCPELQIDPERHEARLRGMVCKTQIENDQVTRDFGFILLGETERGARFVVICGISPFGANIAARAYISIKDLSHEHRRLRQGHRLLFVTQGAVEGYGLAGYSISNVQIVGVHELTA
jgi:hypothetical protein